MTATTTLTGDRAPQEAEPGSPAEVQGAGRELPVYDATDPRRIALRGVEAPRSFGSGSFSA